MNGMRTGILVVLFGLCAVAQAIAQGVLPAEAQGAAAGAPTVAIGWAPVFLDVSARVLPAWALEVSGPTRPIAPVVEVSGWYFNPGSVHTFAGGPEFTLPSTTPTGPRGYVHILGGVAVWHQTGTAYGLALIPGGGVDVPLSPNAAFRLQGDYAGQFAPGDYGRHYWGAVWRVFAGVAIRAKS